jgi:hypothetical protein
MLSLQNLGAVTKEKSWKNIIGHKIMYFAISNSSNSLIEFLQLIESLLKPMEEHTEDAKIEEDAARIPVNIISVSSQHQFSSVSPGQNRHMG